MQDNNISPETLLDDLHPTRFLKVADFLERWRVQNLVVTVSRMAHEETVPNPRNIDPETKKPTVKIQPVLYFLTKTKVEYPRGYLLSAMIDVKSLKSSTGATTVGELIGKQIRIYVGQFKKKAVLRIDPEPVALNPRWLVDNNYASSAREGALVMNYLGLANLEPRQTFHLLKLFQEIRTNGNGFIGVKEAAERARERWEL